MSAPFWTATAVALDTAHGPEEVSGWRYGELFIDFRTVNPDLWAPLPFCWMVSHIPTGLGIVGLLADRRQTQALVESLWQVTDWSAPREHSQPVPEAVQHFVDVLPVEYCLARDTIAPFTTVYRAETVQ